MMLPLPELRRKCALLGFHALWSPMNVAWLICDGGPDPMDVLAVERIVPTEGLADALSSILDRAKGI